MRVDTLVVGTANDRDLGDVRELLRSADVLYHPLPATGDFATLTFAAPPERSGFAPCSPGGTSGV